MNLIALQRHLAARHLHQLRVEKWRQDVPRRCMYRHIEQPRLAHEAPEPAALVPILDNEVAGMTRRFGYFFCGQRDAIPIQAYQFREHGKKLLYKNTVYTGLRANNKRLICIDRPVTPDQPVSGSRCTHRASNCPGTGQQVARLAHLSGYG